MRLLPLLSAIGILAPLAAVAAAGQSPDTVGKYKWVPSRDLVSFYKRHRLSTPTAVLWLYAKGVFRHVLTDDQGTETTLGTYSVEGDKIVLRIESGDGVGLPRTMRLDSDCVSAGDTSFVRDQRIKLPALPRMEPPKATAPGWIVGTWTLRGQNGNEDSTTRFTFTGDGCFRYKGLGGTSAGTYCVTDDSIELQYTEVDGSRLEKSTHMHKALPLRDGCGAFMVDIYRYEKASR